MSSGDSDRTPENNPKNTGETRIAWHPAFFEALRLELDQYRDQLEFMPEYPLTAEPLRIDVLIIKKPKELVITKNIAALFRGVNIIEYKSLRDYVSVEDFYKVYGYACLYISLNKAPVTDLTITFAGSGYPRALIDHLREVRNFGIEERSPGIYTVTGDIIPLQIIENRQLPAEENGWLRDLDHGLSPGELLRISVAVDRLGKAADLRAYLDTIFRANSGGMREVLQMSDEALTLEQVFEEAGLIKKWEARGEAKGEARGEARGEAKGEVRGKCEVARNLITMGLTPEQVAKATGLDMETLKSL